MKIPHGNLLLPKIDFVVCFFFIFLNPKPNQNRREAKREEKRKVTLVYTNGRLPDLIRQIAIYHSERRKLTLSNRRF